MTVKEAIARLDVIINLFDAEMEKASQEFALSLMGMVVNRIQQHGLPGRKYSKNKLPEYWFFDKALNAGGRSLYEKKTRKKIRDSIRERNQFQIVNSTKYKLKTSKAIDEMDEGISYEEWRVANGLQVDHVDLTFSGRMMQNLGIIGTKRVGGLYVTVIGGTNQEIKMRLEYNTVRFGKWFKPTKEEKDLLEMQFKKRIEDFLQNKLAA